jgi:thymidylate synthase ThyX
MFQPQAAIIADSVNLTGDRLTTFEIKLHRYVLAENNTHRAFSRNYQSSRACPVEKMIQRVIDDDVFPLHWGKNQKGMVANQEVDEQTKIDAKIIWNNARVQAIKHTQMLIDIGIHKQVANRLLEPFMAITGIVTATDYQNFFDQRCHPDAQPEIQALAIAMKAAYDASEPVRLNEGEWHLPLINGEDWMEATDRGYVEEDLIKVAIGRCARVSYLNHDGIRSLSDDTKLYWRLLESNPPHLSPFEHCAMALGTSEARANFVGFESYRYQLEHNYEPTEAETAILSATEEEILQMQSRFKDISIETLPRRKR